MLIKHLSLKIKNLRPAGTIGLAKWRLTCFYETFVQSLTSVILLTFRKKPSTLTSREPLGNQTASSTSIVINK
jgi:hypothetical protein